MKKEPELAAQILDVVNRKGRKVSNKDKSPDLFSTSSGISGKKNKKTRRGGNKERDRRERNNKKGKVTSKEAVKTIVISSESTK